MHKRILLLVIAIGIAGACEKSTPTPNPDKADQTKNGRNVVTEGSLSIIGSDGTSKACLKIAIADDETERNTGLMDVHSLNDKTGMIFIFDREQPLSFWMANTPLALDMMFINAKKEIVTIHRDTQPYAESQFKSDKPAQYVLEVRGGWTLENDIQIGDRIEWKRDNE